VGQSPSWEANSHSSIQAIPSLLWNQNVCYRIHDSPPLVRILGQLHPIHTFLPIFLRSILILSTHRRIVVPSYILVLHLCSIPRTCLPPWMWYFVCFHRSGFQISLSTMCLSELLHKKEQSWNEHEWVRNVSLNFSRKLRFKLSLLLLAVGRWLWELLWKTSPI